MAQQDFRVSGSAFTSASVLKSLKTMGAKAPLTLAEELTLGWIIVGGGSDAAKAKLSLVQHNLLAIVTMLKQYCFRMEDQADYLMAVVSVFWEYVEKYDPRMNVRFLSFVFMAAKDTLMDMLNREMPLVAKHSKLHSWVKKFNKIQDSQELPLTAFDFAEMTGCTLQLALEVESEANGYGHIVELNEETAGSYSDWSGIDRKVIRDDIDAFLDKVLGSKKEMWLRANGICDGYDLGYKPQNSTLAALYGRPSEDSVRKELGKMSKKLQELAPAYLGKYRDELYGIVA